MGPLFKKVLRIYIAILLLIPLTNLLIARSFEQDKRNYLKHVTLASKEKAQKGLAHATKRKHPLKPVDPKKYGMMVVPKINLPRNQVHADVFVKNIIKESGILEEEKVISKLKEQNISPEEFQERTKDMDGRIQFYEAKKTENPADEETDERLQQLYLLKSFQGALKDTVTLTPGNQTETPPQNQGEAAPVTQGEISPVNQSETPPTQNPAP